ncbi:MAG: hypothetical protein JXQ81_00410 [Desulfuromonadales bacterium]|nr:hypothetical protein [Desulfuromonadales bacterium]MBN2790945.1 hypothetical protein [Desulfuromonadales bacterium]
MKSERAGARLEVSFQHLLSNFSGPIPMLLPKLTFDPSRRELYVLHQGTEIRIFNAQGMEIYYLGSEANLGAVADIAVDMLGDIYLLTHKFPAEGIKVINYRGEPKPSIKLQGLPEEFQSFRPDQIEYRNEHFYLLASNQLQVVVTDPSGHFVRGHDLTDKFKEIDEEDDKDKAETLSRRELTHNINGFSVGKDGSVYLTSATLFAAFRLRSDGSLDSFGQAGSGAGKFGVVAGISSDDTGNIFVSDMLRSVVLVFDATLEFLAEFGYRGERPEDMIVPNDLVVDSQASEIYVSQAANKGVGVYKFALSP